MPPGAARREHTAIATAARPIETPRLGLGRMAAINAFWLGQGAHWQPIGFALLPIGARLAAPNGDDYLLLIGRAVAAGNLFALLAPIAAGWLSDRTLSRWGRRRPWIVAGTVLNLMALGLMAVAAAPATVILAYLLIQLGFNIAGGAYNGVIPDVVPADQRGRASGVLGAMNQLGVMAGLGGVFLILTLFGGSGRERTGLLGGYAWIIAILLTTLVITVLAMSEPPATRPAQRARIVVRPAALLCAGAFAVAVITLLWVLLFPPGDATLPILGLSAVAAGVAVAVGLRIPAVTGFFSAFRHNDFFWTFATRLFVVFGVQTIAPWLEPYFHDVVGSSNAGAASALWGLALFAGAVVPSVVGGLLSDRTGRRKLFVYISSGMMAAVASVLLFGLVRSLPLLYLLGVLFGIGFGAYYAVDWALACDVLPDRERAAGRDMALWHVAWTMPVVLAPALTAPILYNLNQPGHALFGLASGNHLGFRVVFATAVIWFVLGTIMVNRIRGVR